MYQGVGRDIYTIEKQKHFTMQSFLGFNLMYVVVSVSLDVRVDDGDHLSPFGCQLVLHLNRVRELCTIPGEVSGRKLEQ